MHLIEMYIHCRNGLLLANILQRITIICLLKYTQPLLSERHSIGLKYILMDAISLELLATPLLLFIVYHHLVDLQLQTVLCTMFTLLYASAWQTSIYFTSGVKCLKIFIKKHFKLFEGTISTDPYSNSFSLLPHIIYRCSLQDGVTKNTKA